MPTHDDEMSEAAVAREKELRLSRFKKVLERKRADESSVPPWREREFWNLTADVVPDCWGGKGRLAEYCPMG